MSNINEQISWLISQIKYSTMLGDADAEMFKSILNSLQDFKNYKKYDTRNSD